MTDSTAQESPYSDQSVTDRHERSLAFLERTLGAQNETELLERLAHHLDLPLQRDGTTDVDTLLTKMAEGLGQSRPNEAEWTPEALIQIAVALDERVNVMLSIWDHLGKSPTTLPGSEELLKRVHEDSRFVGSTAPTSAEETITEVMRSLDSEFTLDDVEVYMDQDGPTLFCFETILAHLESLLLDAGASVTVKEADSDDAEDDESADEDDQQDDDAQPVRATVSALPVVTLYEFVVEGQLDLQPPWQRKDVWSLKKKRELIRSLLLGIPLPSIILHQREDKISIIDGKQRLTSIMKFLQNEYKLPNFDVRNDHPLYKCRGCWYNHEHRKSLPDEVRRTLKLRQIPVLMFESVPERRLRQIFHLYNVSGIRLNAAEIRNAVYHRNPIHQAAYVLAGESHAAPDLGTGDYASQIDFTKRLRVVLPRVTRYAALDFLSRYLGYSRAAQRISDQAFKPASTSTTINRYFDHVSNSEDPASVACEIIRVFDSAERFFDIDDDRMPFYRRNDKGQSRFNALVATTNMVAARFLLDVLDAGVMDEKTIQAAISEVPEQYPDNQQTSTIWDYQARVLLALRDALEIDVEQLPATWTSFFEKMALARLPDEPEAAG